MPGRRGHVFAELERLVVGHADGKLAAAALEVAKQVLQPVDQVLAAALDRGGQHFGIGEREIGRRQRVDELAREEAHLARRLRIEALSVGDQFLYVLRGDQVRLLDVVEHEVVLPHLVLEAVVGRGRLRHRSRLLPEHALHTVLPQLPIVLPHLHLALDELPRDCSSDSPSDP